MDAEICHLKSQEQKHMPETQQKCHWVLFYYCFLNTLKSIVHVQGTIFYLFAKSITEHGGDGEFP